MTVLCSSHVPHAVPSGEQTDLPGVGHVPVVSPGIDGGAAGAVLGFTGATAVVLGWVGGFGLTTGAELTGGSDTVVVVGCTGAAVVDSTGAAGCGLDAGAP